MPRQDWETNKAGGKGPAAARESDKSQPQPGCPVHPRSRTGPPCSAALCRAPGLWPGPPSSPAHRHSRCPPSHADGTGHLLLAPCRQRGGLDRSLAYDEHQLCPPQTRLCPAAGAGQPWGILPRLCRVRPILGPTAAGACGCERRQGGLAGRWIAALLQFCIPFLPDKPRRIFINQSATLFNKNLLTYK